jgi:S-adenosyl methyltransferase
MDENNHDAPQSARIWNYWQGGKDNYPIDRDAGDAWIAIQPEIVAIAKQSRLFLMRVVRYLAVEAGIRQFLDIGTGLPTLQNTHQVAQAAAPDSKIVYVDNDPVVLAHARALLINTTDGGVTSYIDADYNNPDLLIAQARNILNFTQPIAVMFMGVLGHVTDYDDARAVVERVVTATPAGSYLTLWENTNTTDTARAAAEQYAQSGAIPYRLCSPTQVAGFFDGLELVEPGVVPLDQWHPTPIEVDAIEPLDAYAAVGRKN